MLGPAGASAPDTRGKQQGMHVITRREALTLSDHIAVMNGGRIVQKASPRTVYDRPATAFVATLFCGPPSLVKNTDR